MCLCLQVCAILSLLPSGSLADLTCEALLLLSGNVSRKLRTNIGCMFSTTARLQRLLQAFKRQLYPSTIQPECFKLLCCYYTCEVELIWSLFHFKTVTTERPKPSSSVTTLPPVNAGSMSRLNIQFPCRPHKCSNSWSLNTWNCSTHPESAHTTNHKCSGMIFVLFARGNAHKDVPGSSD